MGREHQTKGNIMSLTVESLAEGLRPDGDLRIEAEDNSLLVPALAGGDGVDCYPATVLQVKRGDEVVASVSCWKYGRWMKGPNRSDNGEWIGAGWSWQVDDSDGATTGRPRYYVEHISHTVTIQTSDGSGLAITLEFNPQRDRCDLVDDLETIQRAIDFAYGEIEVNHATDEELYEALADSGESESLEVETGIGDLAVELYAGVDAGRPVYTYEGAVPSLEVFDDPLECVKAAWEFIQQKIGEIAEPDIKAIAARLKVEE